MRSSRASSLSPSVPFMLYVLGSRPSSELSHRWYARSRCRGQGQEVSGPRSGKSPRVAMLGRSPLALKQAQVKATAAGLGLSGVGMMQPKGRPQ